MNTPKLDTTPTVREHNGKTILFYSPQQLEAIIPETERLTEQRKTVSAYEVSGGYKHPARSAGAN